MTSRAPPPALRRLICGLLILVTLIAPLLLWILTDRGSLTDRDSVIGLVRVWSVATLLLMIWSAVYIEREPAFTRFALWSTALVFIIVAFQVRSFSTDPASDPASSGQFGTAGKVDKTDKRDQSGKVAKSGTVEDQIIGRWKLVEHEETIEFFTDGTLLGKDEKAVPLFARYVFLDSNRFQVLLAKGNPKTPFIFDDVSIKGDTLTMTNTLKGGSVSYQRQSSPKDAANLAGTWRTDSSNRFIISTEGSFFINDDMGPWNWTGQEFVAQSLLKNGSTWRLALSPDGRTLSGKWSDPTGKSGTSTLRRHLKFDNLADAILGKWQRAGHNETAEYRKDGTAIFTSDDGTVLSFHYSTPDSTHIQIVKKGSQADPLLWTVTTITENALTSTVSDGARAQTYLRIY